MDQNPNTAQAAKEAAVTEIAITHFRVSTLETRNSDSLDFYDVAVWQMKAALLAAYRAGQEASRA